MKLPRVRLTVRRWLALVALVAVGLYGTIRLTDPLPAGWDPDRFQAAVRGQVDPQAQGTTEAVLLAWYTMEDERPLLVDEALVWARVEERGKVRWALLEMYRHPRDRPEWRLSQISHTPPPIQFYDRPPGDAEVERFTDTAHLGEFFRPSANSGFRTLASSVRRFTWWTTVGQWPRQFFR